MSDKQRIPQANIAPFGLRMQPDLKARVEAEARRNQRSLNAEIVARLEQWASLETTQELMTVEITRLDKALREAQSKLKNQSLENLSEILDMALPAKLFRRIEQAAGTNGREILDEIISTLEKAYPPPRPFSLDWFYETWVHQIIESRGEKRERLLDEANTVLKEHGDIYTVWETYAGKGDLPGQIVVGLKRDMGTVLD